MTGVAELRYALDRVAFARQGLGIVPDSWQHDLLRSNSKRILMNCSRQSGKSLMASVVTLHRAMYKPGSLILIMAPAERQAKELMAKVLSSYRNLGHKIDADSYRKLGLQLANGSRIEALPGSEKTLRGFSAVDLLILDEASRVDDERYHAVRPMLAVSGGSLMMLTTPYGKRGVFFDEWVEGVGWERYEVPATSVPRISESFLEEERRALPATVFEQEYFCKFVETEDSVFSFEDVDAAITSNVTPLFGMVS